MQYTKKILLYNDKHPEYLVGRRKRNYFFSINFFLRALRGKSEAGANINCVDIGFPVGKAEP